MATPTNKLTLRDKSAAEGGGAHLSYSPCYQSKVGGGGGGGGGGEGGGFPPPPPIHRFQAQYTL